MTVPLFTVVMATFGRGRHIRPSIESVLRRTFDDFELLVVGDGCTAGAEAVVASVGSPKVRWLEMRDNSGSQAAPNNFGIERSRGRWIAYLGHDDIWSALHLQTLADAIGSPEAPDFVVGGCLFHGPPGVGIVFVNGIFDDPAARFTHFFPPSSVAHRSDAVARIGPWRDPRTIHAPDDSDFLLRAAHAGCRFASTRRVTVHKFAAGHRYLSYLRPDSDEQRAMLGDPRLDRPEEWEKDVAASRAAGTFMTMRHPDYTKFEPGELFLRNRSNKGLARPKLRVLGDGAVMTQTSEPRALDWHPRIAGDGPFRWSGPNRRPKILIPFTHDGPVRIMLCIADRRTPLDAVAIFGPRGRLSPTIYGETILVETTLDRNGYTVLELHAPTVAAWGADGRLIDARLCGIALSDIRIEALGRRATGAPRAVPGWLGAVRRVRQPTKTYARRIS